MMVKIGSDVESEESIEINLDTGKSIPKVPKVKIPKEPKEERYTDKGKLVIAEAKIQELEQDITRYKDKIIHLEQSNSYNEQSEYSEQELSDLVFALGTTLSAYRKQELKGVPSEHFPIGSESWRKTQRIRRLAAKIVQKLTDQ